MSELIAFIGPSLSRERASELLGDRGEVWPPARQGDVWRAIREGPKAIALIDGVFEAQPSVWHREILAALEAGIAVYGASSMGALRAAELKDIGMVPVGEIARRYALGIEEDDDAVALLHGDADSGYRPLTVPLISVEFAAAEARKAKAISLPELRRIMERARSLFYQERTWSAVLDGAELSAKKRASFEAWLAANPRDIKWRDAEECLHRALSELPKQEGGVRLLRNREPAHVRRRRLLEGMAQLDGDRVPTGEVITALTQRNDHAQLASDGLRRALLAAYARNLGISVTPDEVISLVREWAAGLQVETNEPKEFFRSLGMDEAQGLRTAEELALERKLLRNAERVVADGPSFLEAITTEARLTGIWFEEAARVARRRRTRS